MDNSISILSWASRRKFLIGAGVAGAAVGAGLARAYSQAANRLTIRFALRRCGSSSHPARR